MKQNVPLTRGNEGIEANEGNPAGKVWRRRGVIACLLGLSLVAIVNTFEGTVAFYAQHGPDGAPAVSKALVTDVTVLLAILWPMTAIRVVGFGAALLTLGANVAHAEPGFGGLISALACPVFAILLVGSWEWDQARRESRVEPVIHAEPQSEPLVLEPEPVEPTHEPLHLVRESEVEPVVWTRESVMEWMSRTGSTTAQTVAHTGISKATVNRWKREAA